MWENDRWIFWRDWSGLSTDCCICIVSITRRAWTIFVSWSIRSINQRYEAIATSFGAGRCSRCKARCHRGRNGRLYFLFEARASTTSNGWLFDRFEWEQWNSIRISLQAESNSTIVKEQAIKQWTYQLYNKAFYTTIISVQWRQQSWRSWARWCSRTRCRGWSATTLWQTYTTELWRMAQAEGDGERIIIVTSF